MKSMSDAEFKKHEDLCVRCGRCCRAKILWFDNEVKLGDYCEFYDRQKKECMCYEQRFTIYPRCRTVLQSMQEGGMPEDCPYVRDFPGYRSQVKEFQIKRPL